VFFESVHLVVHAVVLLTPNARLYTPGISTSHSRMRFLHVVALAAASVLGVACGGSTQGSDANNPTDALADASAESSADAPPLDAPEASTDVADVTTPADAADVARDSLVDASTDASDVAHDAVSTDTPPPVDACTPLASTSSAIGMSCTVGSDCPAGYTCQPFEGFALTHSCEILCARDCDCPSGGGTCVTRSDKVHSWTQCSGV
jgi:hypothetical protein